MSINVIRYRDGTNARWAVVHGEQIQPLDIHCESTRDFMLQGLQAAHAAAANPAPAAALAEVELLCPITADRQLICQGMNYSSHLREIGVKSGRLPFNTLFRKASSCLAPADTDIIRPAHVRLLDYEIEIGIVLKRAITGPVKVTRDNLADYVGALVLHNDVSARDIQLPQMQFYKGKSYRTFGPTGPWLTLVDADDLASFDSIGIELCVNGQTRQKGSAADLVFGPAETLTELSEIQDADAGDLLVTGTPGGTAVKAPPPLKMFIARLLPDAKRWQLFIENALADPDYLKDGDQLTLTAATPDGRINLGEHHNTIVAAVPR